MRPTASTASTRTRHQQPRDNLFAPNLSRRPTARSTPKVEDEVLADPESEAEAAAAAQRHRQTRRARQGSPESRIAGGKARVKTEELPQKEDEAGVVGEIVNRREDGGYLLGVSAGNEALAQHLFAPELKAELEVAETDAQDAANARSYWTSGVALGGRGSKKMEEEFDEIAPTLMVRLREQAMQKIESERWMYEPLDRYQAQLH
ncbi:hypothetical protein KC367_g8621 [Hortaea werneckii]|uniref:Uncharacterized protein n=2 Tax=Hortaea werneckii TaxID=91943 RepID=A0A3M7I342_HORWE|nr:hypothetical protein KC350_g15565 [Hortaea werneckii]OTA23372.1 hypothetical protein BTJ68_13518 [Hortaea werneckii EXF-2000]KAI6808633.1 hypothetical protein KC358_g12945 [Hortaea werneckii]KAI6816147.1 hypothetical protein KC342_g15605 [Hortaea werneckii]KAI6908565.1 hypothetical protein KC348_g13789 [Hortaea werneckii]